MLTLDGMTGQVTWDQIVIRPGTNRAEFGPAPSPYALPKTRVGDHDVTGHVTFAAERVQRIAFTFSMPGDERGWEAYSIKTEFERHSLGLALLESQLGAPHQVLLYPAEGLQFRQCRYAFGWGTVQSYFDGRGGGTQVEIIYMD